uniref:Uncharacterized protein n=1 Tax=Arundo donax TaxID=35708 RepID=A0A0A9CS05_ARUDO
MFLSNHIPKSLLKVPVPLTDVLMRSTLMMHLMSAISCLPL